MTDAAAIVQKLWSYCNLLRDDGLSYSEYVEQLTYLLFLKMADERTKPPFLLLQPLPRNQTWASLLNKTGDALLDHYSGVLRSLGRRRDLYGAIFSNAVSKFKDPAKFQRLVQELIDGQEWSRYDTDIKGDAYEGLLERTAAEGKAGAGQYFTPRPLIRAIVAVVRPKAGETICDPACGTGGFLLAAHDFVRKGGRQLSERQIHHLNSDALSGVELVDSVARLCLMNLVLHGIGGEESPISVRDALDEKHGEYDVILTNPPFGRKSAMPISAGERHAESRNRVRTEFWASTNNKQLNFLQHVFSILKPGGRAAVVVPDNVLFEAGAGEIIRRELLQRASVHTLLRLPTGIFYAQGVKANVLFFDRIKRTSDAPLWVYDLRTNTHLTLRENPLDDGHLTDFVQSFSAANRDSRNESERFRRFERADLLKRDRVNLDLFWMADETSTRPAHTLDPRVIAAEITEDLQAALEQFSLVADDFRAMYEEGMGGE